MMKSRKVNGKIIVQHDSGSFSSYTPRQAAKMILILKRELWRGIPLTKEFKP
jgi:hypothetical protein